MGDPRKLHKSYSVPLQPWDRDRMEKEAELIRNYGLRSKKEVWKNETILRSFRREARRLMAASGEQAEREARQLLERLRRLGLVEEDSTLVDVLDLEVENILDRRLQSVVCNRGLARSPLQARQMIVHGHIVVRGKRVTVPSYLVPIEEEEEVDHHPNSSFKERFEPEEMAESAGS